MWLSVRPGTSPVPASWRMTVLASQHSRTAASSPTAIIVPSRYATAEAAGRAGSSVRMRAPMMAPSAKARAMEACYAAPPTVECRSAVSDPIQERAREARTRKQSRERSAPASRSPSFAGPHMRAVKRIGGEKLSR